MRGVLVLVLEVALVVALFGGGVAAIVAFSRWHASSLERTWRAAAERLSGELTFRAGWFDVTCSLAVTIDGQRVTVTPGRKQEVYARSAATHPPGFVLKVEPRPPNFLVDRARAVATGDPTFDVIFNVEATDANLAKSWLDEPLRERISRAGHVWLQLRDDHVVGNRTVFAFETEALDHLVRAVAALAAKSRGHAGAI